MFYVMHKRWKIKEFIKLNCITPFQNVVKIATNVNFQGVAYLNAVVYGFGNSLVYFYVLEKKKSPNIDSKALNSKKKVIGALAALELPVERTVVECQRKLLKHQKNISKHYETANWNQSVIVYKYSWKRWLRL